MEVTVANAGTQTLVRLAWHIGNRHVPAQLEPQRILIRDDPVIVNMLVGLGAIVRPVMAAFTPEAGAYDIGSTPAAQHLPESEHSHGTQAQEHRHD